MNITYNKEFLLTKYLSVFLPFGIPVMNLKKRPCISNVFFLKKEQHLFSSYIFIHHKTTFRENKSSFLVKM